MKWIFLTIVILANAVGSFFILVPSLITYAEVQPKGITCSKCSDPEVKKALTAAATYGRGMIISQMQASAKWMMGLSVFNILAVGLALFAIRSSNNRLERDAGADAPRPSS